MSVKRDLSKYRDIVSGIRIDHSAYESILSELTDAYDAVGTTATPVCLLITGESRTGKSSVVRDLLESYLPTRTNGQTIRRVVYAVAPAKATLKSLLESLLHGLGDPHWSQGSLGNMTHRLYTQLDAVQCRMIILDEFQHLSDTGRDKSLRLLADWLKLLVEGRKYGLVAVGLPTAASIVDGHKQLRCRFDERLTMPLFDWQDRTSAKQFRAILGQFQEELHPFKLPKLDSPEMGLRFYLASAGRIGLVAKILDRAVKNATRAGTLNIGIEALQTAYGRAIWSARRFPVGGGPFGAKEAELLMTGLQESVLAIAAQEIVADESSAVEVHGQGETPPVSEAPKTPTASRGRCKKGTSSTKGRAERVKVRKRPDARRELRRAL